jgi:sugar phosphate isomerase/epimerase
MRLSTACYGFRQWSLENYLEAASGLGVDFVEIGYTQHGTLQQLYWQGEPGRGQLSAQGQGTHVAADGVRRLHDAAANAGVRPVSGAAEYRLWGVTPTWLEWAKTMIRMDVEIGGEMRLETVRGAIAGPPPGIDEADVFDQIAQTGAILNELAKNYAEPAGVTLVIENYRASTKLMLAIAKHFTSPNVGLHFDTHNVRRVGEDPIEAIRELKEFVRYVHLKDYREEDAHILPTDTWWSSWAVGDGDIDWRSFMEELGSFYGGVASLEYEKSLHDVVGKVKQGVGIIRGLMQELGIPEERLSDDADGSVHPPPQGTY